MLILLPGVMRFLQTEWHRHERDRNAWQIERAEMKSRIGKLEGDLRTNKRLRESMDKHIRMLEQAMRKKNQEQPFGAKVLEDKPKGVQEGKTSAKPSPSLKRKSRCRILGSKPALTRKKLKCHPDLIIHSSNSSKKSLMTLA